MYFSGSKVLSQYGEEFFQALEKLVKDHQLKRDREVSKIEDIVEEQTKLDQQLSELLEEQEAKLPQSNMTSNNEYSDMTTSVYEHRNMTSPKDEQDDKFVPEFVEKKKNVVKPEQESSRDTSRSDKAETSQWLSQLRSRDQSDRHKAKVKKLHQKEWVDIIDVAQLQREISDPTQESNEICDSSDMSNAELFALHANDIVDPLPQENATLIFSKDSSNLSDKPPTKHKVKKKLGYTPNTFVPNRTLQLRRSGSLNRVNTPDQNDFSLENAQGHFVDNQTITSELSSLNIEQGRQSTKHKHFKPRPAFR